MDEIEDWKWGYYHLADRQSTAQGQSSAAPAQEGAEGAARSDA
jgi:hypothetical protein